MSKHLVWLGLVCLFCFGCKHEPLKGPNDQLLRERLDNMSPTGNSSYYIFPEANDFSSIPNQDDKNPINAEKAELGKMLFHETGLAASPAYPIGESTYSCATCHIASRGFTPGRAQGLADGGLGFAGNRHQIAGYLGHEVDAQGARPLSVLNVAYVTNTLWSGTFGSFGINEGTEALWHGHENAEVNLEGLQGLEAQNIEGLELHRMEITDVVLDQFGYREHFDRCFPDFPAEERYSHKTASFAISAYLRTLLAQEAPFQKWLNGEDYAITEQEKRGALLFLGKANCSSCHKGPSFNSMEFHALGTKDLYEQDEILNTDHEDNRNRGRAFFTDNAEDDFKFKVPQLYNLKDYTHFFHGSSKQTIREVVEYKLRAESENPYVAQDQLSSFFHPVEMSEDEINDLVAFLENALHDPDLERYVPESVLSGNCIPNNDVFSRIELDCD
ncbi:MAG: hypothetical protein HKN16_03550 [Saprospiraceae bacterium]|nr:hypothetical protein [Saprospiraceae bacterium]